MLCPRCNSTQVFVVDSRPHGDTTRRRRECRDCKVRFSTLEVLELDYKDLKGKEAILARVLKNVSETVAGCHKNI